MGFSLIPWGSNEMEKRLSRQLALKEDEVFIIAEAARAAMDEISTTHGYAEYKIATTLAGVQAIRARAAASGTMTPLAELARDSRTQRYLEQMAELEALAGEEIIYTAVNSRRRW